MKERKKEIMKERKKEKKGTKSLHLLAQTERKRVVEWNGERGRDVGND